VVKELKVRDHDTSLGRHDYKHSEIDHEDLEYDKVYPCTNALDQFFLFESWQCSIPIASTSIHNWFHQSKQREDLGMAFCGHGPKRKCCFLNDKNARGDPILNDLISPTKPTSATPSIPSSPSLLPLLFRLQLFKGLIQLLKQIMQIVLSPLETQKDELQSLQEKMNIKPQHCNRLEQVICPSDNRFDGEEGNVESGERS